MALIIWLYFGGMGQKCLIPYKIKMNCTFTAIKVMFSSKYILQKGVNCKRIAVYPEKGKIMGTTIGKINIAFIDNDLFWGFAFRIGKDCKDGKFYMTLQFGSGMLYIDISG